MSNEIISQAEDDVKIVRTTSTFDCGGRCPLRLHVKDKNILNPLGGTDSGITGDYLDLIGHVADETYRVLRPGGRYVINIANLGRKPYIPLHASSDCFQHLNQHQLIQTGPLPQPLECSAHPAQFIDDLVR